MLKTPFYDPTKSYDENYNDGPFGGFADGVVYAQKGDPSCDFLGYKIYSPFGIPAGPLLNSKFIKGSFEKGFDLAVYKTVRSDAFQCHPFPNILSVKVEHNLSFEKAKNEPLTANNEYKEPLSITNSFGVPSKAPAIWQEDVRQALQYEKPGQIMILSFMGTAKHGQQRQDFIADYVRAGKLAAETGAKILEVNFSCPNIGNEGLVCYDIKTAEEVCQGIRSVIGNTPLIVKVGYYENQEQLAAFARVIAPYAQGIAAINTIQATIVDKEGKQALPGEKRQRSGVCGASIKWAGLEMTQRLKALRESTGLKYVIVGVGGVMVAEDYAEYKKAGADVVMSATGAMWNPDLAKEIKEKYL